MTKYKRFNCSMKRSIRYFPRTPNGHSPGANRINSIQPSSRKNITPSIRAIEDSYPISVLPSIQNKPKPEFNSIHKQPHSRSVKISNSGQLVFRSENDQEQFENIYESYIDKRVLPPVHLENSVFKKLQEDTLQSILQERYEDAEKLHGAIYDLLHAEEEEDPNVNELNWYLQRLDNLREKLEDQNQKWQLVFDQFASERLAKENVIIKRQKKAMENLDLLYNDESFLMRFSKPSSQLLQYRRIQQSCVLQNRFREARTIKAQADKMQTEESKKAEKAVSDKIKKMKENLSIRHKKELEIFYQHQSDSEFYLKSEKARICNPIEKHIRIVEDAINRIKLDNSNKDSKSSRTSKSLFTSEFEEREFSPNIRFPMYFRDDFHQPLELEHILIE